MVRLAVIALVALNLLLIVLEASKPKQAPPPEAATAAVPPLPDAPTIRLLDELLEGRVDDPGSRCFTIGPFEAGGALATAREALAGLVDAVSERPAETEVERGFWVYVPPFESLEAAREAASRMRAAGIIDVNVLGDGEWRNSISLGYFLNESNGAARRDQVRDQGFEAQVRVQQATEVRYWLDYEQTIGSPLAAPSLAADYPALRHDAISCLSMAPPEPSVPYSAR